MVWNQIRDFIVLDPGSALVKFCGSGSTFDQYGSTSLESCLSVCSKENRLKEKSVWFWLASMPARNVLAGLRMIDRYTREMRWREGKPTLHVFILFGLVSVSVPVLYLYLCMSDCLSAFCPYFFSFSLFYTYPLISRIYFIFLLFILSYFHCSGRETEQFWEGRERRSEGNNRCLHPTEERRKVGAFFWKEHD